jgi:hypothetical protein
MASQPRARAIGQDTVAAQIGVARGRRADAGCFIGQATCRRAGVGVGVDGDGGDPHLLAGADDADGDLAAIGDQDFAKHGNYQTISVEIGLPSIWVILSMGIGWMRAALIISRVVFPY